MGLLEVLDVVTLLTVNVFTLNSVTLFLPFKLDFLGLKGF